MKDGMTIVVCGGGGQLASSFFDYFKMHHPSLRVVSLEEKDLDVTARDVTEKLRLLHPAYVINTAAFHNMDACETEPARAYEVNAWGGYNVVRAAHNLDAKYLFISTGYVFDGTKQDPYVETDIPRACSVYGNSKLLAERFIETYDPTALIVRTSALFGVHGPRMKGGGNFIDFAAKNAREGSALRIVADQFITPTSCGDLVKACAELLFAGEKGVFHITNSGEATWHAVAEYVYSLMESKGTVSAIISEEYATVARRPLNNILSMEKWESSHASLPHWKDAVREYLRVKEYIS